MKPKKSLPGFLADNFRLQRADFGIMLLVPLGVWALVLVIVGVLDPIVGDPADPILGVAGIFAFAAGAFCSGICSMSRSWLEFRIGVQMSNSRRRMLLAILTLDLALGGLLLAEAFVLNKAGAALFRALGLPGAARADLLAQMPLWGWLLALVLPAAAGTLGGALVLRFGRRAGWAMYFLFLACCISPSVLDDLAETNLTFGALLEGLLPFLPALGFAASAAALIVSAALLLRASISE